jgi:hypothetical protein
LTFKKEINMARLQVVNISKKSVLLIVDQCTDEEAESYVQGYVPDGIPGVAGIIASQGVLDYDPGYRQVEGQVEELDLPTLTGVVSPQTEWDKENAHYFHKGYVAGARDRVDPSLSDNFDDGVVCFTPTPITHAQLKAGGPQPESVEQAVAFAVAQAGMSAPYGPGSGVFDSTSAKEIVDWAVEPIERITNQDSYDEAKAEQEIEDASL